MNHIFRVIFDKTRGVFVAVSELTKSHGKAKSEQNIEMGRGKNSISLVPRYSNFFAFNSVYSAFLISAGILSSFFISPTAHASNVYTFWGKIGTVNCNDNSARSVSLAIQNGQHDNTLCQAVESVGIGYAARADASGSVVIGKDSLASSSATNSISLGQSAKVTGRQGIALGNNSGASSQATALGADVFAVGNSSIALGNDDITSATYQDKLPVQTILDLYAPIISQGYYNQEKFKYTYITEGNYDTTTNTVTGADKRIYSPTLAAKLGAIAIGSRTVAGGEVSTALGSLSFALADRSTAVGIRAFVDKNAIGGTAIGEESRVFASQSVAIGNLTEASRDGSMAYGYKAVAAGKGAIAIGSQVAANAYFDTTLSIPLVDAYTTLSNSQGTNTDFATFESKLSTALQNGLPLRKDSNIYLSTSEGEIKRTTNFSANDTDPANNAIAIGNSSFAVKKNSLALGFGTLADADNSFAIGSYAYVNSKAKNTIVLGVAAYASATDSFAAGTRARIGQDAHFSVALGTNASVNDNVINSTAIGYQSKVTFNNSVALGFQSITDYKLEEFNQKPWAAKGAIATPTSSKSGVISVGSKGQERRIINLASGALDTDAVNVSQLRTIDEKFETAIASLQNGSGLQYVSIEHKNEAGEAGALTASIKKTDNYQKYVKMKTELQYLEVRRQVNEESFDTTAFNEYKKQVDNLGALYSNAVSRTATSLAAIDSAIRNAVAELARMPTGTQDQRDQKEARRQVLLEDIKDKIAKASTADQNRTMAGVLSATQAEAAKQNTNYNNDGAKGADSIAFGWKASTAATTGNQDSQLGGKRAIAIGFEAQANALNAIAIGSKATVNNTDKQNSATGKFAIAIGSANTVSGEKSIAIGFGHTVSGNNSGAFGDPDTVNFDNSYIVGNNSTIGTAITDGTEVGSFVMGNNVTVTKDQIFVLGNNVNTTDIDFGNSVFLGSNTGYIKDATISKYGSRYLNETINGLTFGDFANGTNSTTPILGIVSIGSSTQTRRLQGVTPGLLAAGSTDAINGSQLYATNAILGTLATSIKNNFGGNANLNATTGAITLTNIGGTNKNTVEEAIAASREVVEAAANGGLKVDTQTTSSGANKYVIKLDDKLKEKLDSLSPGGGPDQPSTVDLTGKANTNLGNINDQGKSTVRDLAKEAVKVVNGTNTTVEEGSEGNAKTYKVNITDETIKRAAGTTNLATEYAKADASNISNHITNWQNALGAIQFTGDKGSSKSVKLGETIKIYGQSETENAQDNYTQNNIQVFGGNNGLFIQLAKNLNGLESVTTDNLTATTFKLGTGTNAPSLTADNGNIKLSDGAKITNLTNGDADNDAATVKQVKDLAAAVALSFTTDSKVAGNGTAVKGKVKLSEQSLALNGTDDFITTSSTEDSQAVKIDLTQNLKDKLTKLDHLTDNANDTYATKEEIKNLSSTLNFNGDNSSSGTVDLKTQQFTVKGTANEIETTAAGQNLTIKLAKSITDKIAQIDNKANKTLDNLDNRGKDVITGLVSGSVATSSTEYLTVDNKAGTNGQAKNIQIGLSESAIKKLEKIDAAQGVAKATQKITLQGKDGTKTDDQTLANDIDFTITGNDDIKTEAAGKTLTISVNKDGQVVSGNNSLVTGGVVHTAIEAAKTNLTNLGLKFAADSGSEITRKLGEKLTINGTSDLIKTTVSEGKVTIDLDDQVKNKLNNISAEEGATAAKGSQTIKLTAGDSQSTTAQTLSQKDGINFKITNEDSSISTTAKDDAIKIKVADNGISTAKLADKAVTTAKIGDNAVTTEKINDNAVTTAKINDKAVTTDKINDDAVTTAKIKDGTITAEKLEGDLSSKVTKTYELVDNTIQLGADSGNTTAKRLDSDAIKFTIKGADGLTTTAENDELVVKLDSTTKAKTDKIDINENLSSALDKKANKNADNLDSGDVTAWKQKLGIDQVSNTKDLTYKANGINDKKVAFTSGLDFTDTDNITASVADNGVVKFALKAALTRINSIQGNGTTLTINDDSLSLNDKKVSGVKKGTNDNDVVNVAQLKPLVNSLGATLESDGRITQPTFNTTIKYGNKAENATSAKDAIDKLIAAVNSGLSFAADKGTAQTKQLGQTLKIGAGDLSKEHIEADLPDNATFVGKNIQTGVDKATGNILIGFNDKPEFGGLTLKDSTPNSTKPTLTLSPDGTADNPVLALNAGSTDAPKDAELKGIAKGTANNSAVNKQQLDEGLENLAKQIGISDTANDGATGPAGADGLNGRNLAEKVNAQRDGLSGNMVYTDESGNRLVKVNDNYYLKSDLDKYVQAKDGKWYAKDKVNDDGTLKDTNDSTGKDNLSEVITENSIGAVGKDKIAISSVNPDGTTTAPIALQNIRSGLGLTGTVDNQAPENGDAATALANPSAINTEAAQKVIAGDNKDGQGGLLTAKGAALNKAASIGDLQALAQAGLDFAGNNKEDTIHRPLGTALKIVGDAADNETWDKFTSAQGNIRVQGDKSSNTLTIQLADQLKDIVSITGKAANGGTAATITLNSATTADSTPSVALNNAKLTGLAEGSVTQGSTDAVTGGQLYEQKNNVDKLNNGSAGTVVYTNDTGDRVEKAQDGNYYTKDFIDQTLKSYVYKNGHWYANQENANSETDNIDDMVANHKIDNPILSLVKDGSTTTPITLSNLVSGLGVDLELTDPENAKKLVKNLLDLDGKDADSANALKEKAQLNRAATVADLQALARAGFSILGNQDIGVGLIHLPLGSTLKIEGKQGAIYRTDGGQKNDHLYSADNLITHKDGDALRIEILKKPGFDGVYLNKDATQDGSLGGYIGVDKDGSVVVNKVTAANDGKPASNGIDDKGQVTTTKVVTEDSLNRMATLTYSANGKRVNNSFDSKHSVSLADGLDFIGDKNITTSVENGGKVNIKLNKDLTEINSIGGGDGKGKVTFTDRDKQGANEKESVIDANGSVITNIANPTQDFDAANKGYVDGQIKDVKNDLDKVGETANVAKTLAEKGLNIATNDDTAKNMALGDTIRVENGANVKVSEVTTEKDTDSDVTTFKYTISVKGIPMTYVDKEGKPLVQVGDDFYRLDSKGLPNFADGVVETTEIGGIKAVKDPTKLNDQAISDDALATVEVADGKVQSGKVENTKRSKQAVNGGQLADLLGKDATVKDGKTVVENIGGTKANNLNDAIAEVKADAAAAKTEVKVKGKNLSIEATKGDNQNTIYTLQVSDTPEFDKVTIGGKVSMTASTDKDGTNVLNVDEDTPSRIRGVADGVAPTDAVNRHQLDMTTNNLDRKINQVSRDANAGTASAMAVAGLPQANQAGYNMISVASGYYGGENAVAIGISKVSDNGKVIFKVSGTSNSQGKMGMNAGVGYQWR